MKEYIAMDCHKTYSLVEWENIRTERVRQKRVEHEPGAIRRCLAGSEPGTPVAVEATGNWYWIIDEIEQAGLVPLLVHPRKAKLMMGMINKTDKLDVHGLNRLQRNRTLPTVWIPPGPVRDLRELTRGRMAVSRQRAQVKNRIQATLAKYGLVVKGYTDPFGKAARTEMETLLVRLPSSSQWMTQLLLDELDALTIQIKLVEARLKTLAPQTPEVALLRSLPGVGEILSWVIALEIGDITRFASGERLASYSGTTPRVHSSGGKTRYGRLRADVNRYLKWAFVEAANSVALHHNRKPDRHVSELYRRLHARKGHPKAIGAVARHLAEAAYHVLNRRESYRDPALGRIRKASARPPHEPVGSGSECDRPSEHFHAPSRAKR